MIGGDGPSVSLAANFGRTSLREAFELRTSARSARDLFDVIDVLLVPSTVDVQPHAVLEALCWGVPVIGANVGAIAEAIAPFETGWIVPDDPQGFADGIASAWAAIDSPGRARALSEAPLAIASAAKPSTPRPPRS